jgi:hypothetical protein
VATGIVEKREARVRVGSVANPVCVPKVDCVAKKVVVPAPLADAPKLNCADPSEKADSKMRSDLENILA